MSNAWRSFGELAPVVGICGAGFLLLLLRLARSDRRDPRPRRLTAAGMSGLWALAVAAVTLRPQPLTLDESGRERAHSVDLVPLRSIASQLWDTVGWQIPAEQIIGNLALFAPLGVLVAMLWPRPQGWRLAVLAGLGTALAIEVAQLLLPLGRVTSIDDVILGGAGSGLGWAATRAASRFLAPAQTTGRPDR